MVIAVTTAVLLLVAILVDVACRNHTVQGSPQLGPADRAGLGDNEPRILGVEAGGTDSGRRPPAS